MKLFMNVGKLKQIKIDFTKSRNEKLFLIFGSNGAGKTTISNFLYVNSHNFLNNKLVNKEDVSTSYSGCNLNNLSGYEIFVCNDEFKKDNFYINETLKNQGVDIAYIPLLNELQKELNRVIEFKTYFNDFKEVYGELICNYKDMIKTNEESQEYIISDLAEEEKQLFIKKEVNEIKKNKILTEKWEEYEQLFKSTKEYEDEINKLEREISTNDNNINKLLGIEKYLLSTNQKLYFELNSNINIELLNLYEKYIQSINICLAKNDLKNAKSELKKYIIEIQRYSKKIVQDYHCYMKKYQELLNKLKDYKDNTLIPSIAITNSFLLKFDLCFKLELEGGLVRIKRESEQYNFKGLSSGEKQIITILYFMSYVELYKKNNPNKKIFVVFDDPITSISSEYIWIIVDLFRRFLNDNSNKDNALLILSHHFYFINEMKNVNSKNDYNFKHYNLISGNKIEIDEKYEVPKCEYHLYWYLWFNYRKNPDFKIIMPNIMRNILEYHSSIFLVEKFGSNFQNDKNLRSNFQNDKNLGSNFQDDKYFKLYKFVNKESHSTDKNDDQYKECCIDRMYKLFEEYFEKYNKEHMQKLKDKYYITKT